MYQAALLLKLFCHAPHRADQLVDWCLCSNRLRGHFTPQSSRLAAGIPVCSD
jgi:hypothetical protein